MAKYLDEGGVKTLWGKIKSLFYKKTEVDSKLEQKMNNGIIQAHRGQEVSFKTEGNQNNVIFNYRSEQTQPITRFEFHAGKSNGEKANIVCADINCHNINAGNELLLNGNEATIKLNNPQANYPMIKFKASTTEPYGHGIVIGGGGSVVIGAGESADTVYSNPIVPNAGDENLRLASDEKIYFYTGQQNGFVDRGTYIDTNGAIYAQSKKLATEEQVNNKIDKSDLTFSLSGTTLTITKR